MRVRAAAAPMTSMGSIRSSGLYRLLWPHAKPYTGKLFGVFCCSLLAAFLVQSVLLLLVPTWSVLFPEKTAVELRAEEIIQTKLGPEASAAIMQAHVQAKKEAVGDAEASWKDRIKIKAEQAIIGDPGDLKPAKRKRLLWIIAGLVSALAIAAGAVTYIGMYLSAAVGLAIIVSLRQDLVRHLMHLSLRYHGRRKFGDLLSRMSADVSKAQAVTNILLRDLVQEPMMAIVALVGAFFLAPQAALVVLVGLPLLLLPVSILLKKMRTGSNKSLDELGSTTQSMTQIFSGIRTVKAYRAEERELVRFAKTQQGYIEATLKMVRASAMSVAWSISYTHIGMGVMVVLVGYMILSGVIPESGGSMLAFFMLISAAYQSIKRTLRAHGTVAEAQGACDRLLELVDEEADIIEPENAHVLTGLGSGVAIRGLGFSYEGEETPALQSIDLELRPGETLALVGPSGSGKSTMIDLVARFLDPNEGRIEVDGKDLRGVTLDSWSEQYSMVTQSPFLFHDSIEENIRYGKPNATHEQVVAAAEAADIHAFIESLPNGYQTDVADAGSRLSGGQRQRITIARAVLHGAPLLLLDEATSALDTESERAVQEALDRLMQGQTSIVIAHRLSTIQNADRIAVLDQGRLVELGTHEELIEKKGVYANLHALQFRTA